MSAASQLQAINTSLDNFPSLFELNKIEKAFNELKIRYFNYVDDPSAIETSNRIKDMRKRLKAFSGNAPASSSAMELQDLCIKIDECQTNAQLKKIQQQANLILTEDFSRDELDLCKDFYQKLGQKIAELKY